MESKNDERLQDFSVPLLKKLKDPCIKPSSKNKKNKQYVNNNNDNNNSSSGGSNQKKNSGLLSNSSTYSILPISEVTQGAVEVWANLPDEIRQDPSLASFRQEHERIHGEFTYLKLNTKLKVIENSPQMHDDARMAQYCLAYFVFFLFRCQGVLFNFTIVLNAMQYNAIQTNDHEHFNQPLISNSIQLSSFECCANVRVR